MQSSGQYKLQRLPSLEYFRLFIFICFVLWCCGCKRRQVLICSSSSQIPGAFDYQACCNCCDLHMGVQCICFVNNIVGIVFYKEAHYCNCFSYWLYSHICSVRQNIFNCSTAQESDSVRASKEVAKTGEMTNFAALV